MKTTLKAPGTKRLKLENDELLSNFAFNCTLRRYTMADDEHGGEHAPGVGTRRNLDVVGWCRLNR
jgi:hypothetical protein